MDRFTEVYFVLPHAWNKVVCICRSLDLLASVFLGRELSSLPSKGEPKAITRHYNRLSHQPLVEAVNYCLSLSLCPTKRRLPTDGNDFPRRENFSFREKYWFIDFWNLWNYLLYTFESFNNHGRSLAGAWYLFWIHLQYLNFRGTILRTPFVVKCRIHI